MGSTTPHGLPYPVGTDRIMDGDNAIQALAEAVDTALWSGAAPGAPAPGIWAAATGTVVCNATSLAAQPGTSVQAARYMKIGRTAFFCGEATCTSAVNDAAINLPNGLAGVPYRRVFCTGLMVVMGTGVTGQYFHGVMTAGLTQIVMVTNAGAYINVPAAHTIRWNISYETAT